MLKDHPGQRDPKLSDRVVSVLLSRIVHTDTMLRCDEGCCQIPPKHLFLGRDRTLGFRSHANGECLS